MGEGKGRDRSAVLPGRTESTSVRETETMEGGAEAGSLGDSVRLRVRGTSLKGICGQRGIWT